MNKMTVITTAVPVVLFLVPPATSPVSLVTTNAAHIQTSLNREESHDHTHSDNIDTIRDFDKGVKVYGNLSIQLPTCETFVQFATLVTTSDT